MTASLVWVGTSMFFIGLAIGGWATGTLLTNVISRQQKSLQTLVRQVRNAKEQLDALRRERERERERES